MKSTIYVVFVFLKTVYMKESCPKGLTTPSSNLLVVGQSCFQFVHDDTRREQAQDACASKSGSLAVIPNNLTQSTLFKRGNSLLGEEITTRYWIGGRLNRDGAVSWDNGLQTAFTNLASNVRYRSTDSSCLLLQLDDGEGKWTTADCNRGLWFYGYICQYKTVRSAGVDSSSRTGNSASFSSYNVSSIFSALLISLLLSYITLPKRIIIN